MLQTAFSALFLEPDDLALLARVLIKINKPEDTIVDREVRAASLLQLFQSGVCDEEDLIRAVTRRGRD